MHAKEAIHRLLYLALLEIRDNAQQTGNRFLLFVSDVFLLTPLQLDQVTQNDSSYDQLFDGLHKRAVQINAVYAQWFEQAVTNQATWHADDRRSLIHRLLYVAFIDMRMEAYETRNVDIFNLAELCHNIPLQLLAALRGEVTYDAVLESVHRDALRIDMEEWLEQALIDVNKDLFETIER